ncbi:unnamed protein product [Paramecium octaurelia]|uniref:Uncharacterized protein n=1 Tax=Paramecium octaurelia TaxID=43137 RepID=A0A8S1WIT9_PAROT|nr:unnamed protein product [Paramecium octaurelia]
MDFQLPKRYGLNKPTFKVMAGQHFAKFDSSLKPLKNLNTFIDLSKPIKELNYIEHRKVRQIMQHLKFQSQSRRFINHQDEQIAAISQQLEMELENLAREDCPTPQVDLVKLKFPPEMQTKFVHESAATLETHYNLHRIKERMNHRNITLTESDLLNKITSINFQTARNTDTKEFYHNFNSSHPRAQKEQHLLSLDEKYQILKEYLKERGIVVGRKESVPNEGYLQFYHEATNRLMRQTKEQQLLKFRKSITLKTAPDNQDHSPLKKMSITKITTVPTTVGTTPALNGVTPSNLTTLHQSIIRLNAGNNSSPVFISHRHRIEREKSPEKPYSEKWQDFQNKTEALQSYYLHEGKECQQTLEDLENTIEKPYLRHFNQIIKVEQEQGNLEEEQKQNKIMRKRKQNLPKKLRMQKIFKSELQ